MMHIRKNIIPVILIILSMAVIVDFFLGHQFGLGSIFQDWASMTPYTAVLFILLFSTVILKTSSVKTRLTIVLLVLAISDLLLGLMFDSREIISSRGTSLVFIVLAVHSYLFEINQYHYLRLGIKFSVYCMSIGLLVLYFIDPQSIYRLPWLETVSWNTSLGFLVYTSIYLTDIHNIFLNTQSVSDDIALINLGFLKNLFIVSFFSPVIIILALSLLFFFRILEPQTGMAVALFLVCLLPFPVTYFLFKEMLSWSNLLYQKNRLLKQRNEDIQYHNELLREFAQITSHNLRGPAVGIENLASIAFDDSKRDEIRERSQDLLKEKIPILASTIDQLAGFYNVIKEGKVEYANCDLKEYIQNSLTNCINNSSIHEEEVQLDLELDVVEVEYPPVYLENLFYNLFSNSIKYRKKDQPLIIIVSSKRDGTMGVTINYKDNGIGINLEYFKEKIFEFGKSYHNHEDSKGIGLFIVKNQLSRLGDLITVQSEEGKFTEFTIKLNHRGKKELGYN